MFQLLGGTLTDISKGFLGSLHYSGLVVKNLCDGILMGTRFVSLYPIFVVKFMKSFKFTRIKSSTVHVYCICHVIVIQYIYPPTPYTPNPLSPPPLLRALLTCRVRTEAWGALCNNTPVARFTALTNDQCGGKSVSSLGAGIVKKELV